MTVADLVIDALVQSEWALSQQVAELRLQNEQLVTLVADLAYASGLFEQISTRWLKSLGTSRRETEKVNAEIEALKEELRRYVAARVGPC